MAILRKIIAECVGTSFLLIAIVGSGHMVDQLAQGHEGIALLANGLAIAAGLLVLITIFGPISGAHFNPVVSLVFLINGDLRPKLFVPYVLAQCLGAAFGVFLSHLMFGEEIIQVAMKVRSSPHLWFSEALATFGLIMVIFGALFSKPHQAAALVSSYVFAAIWFSGSTAFANPAVTLARSLTDSFTAIRLEDVSAFVVAQIIGALAGYVFSKLMFQHTKPKEHP